MENSQLIQKFQELFHQHLGYGYLLSQKDLDQGDTSQRTGTLIALIRILKAWKLFAEVSPSLTPKEMVGELEAAFGLYRRSPNPMFWGYDVNNLSRDQLSILKLGMSLRKLFAVFLRQMMRLGFHQNTRKGADDPEYRWKMPDIITPTEIAWYCRSFLGPLSVIPNHILDLGFFVDLLLRKDDNWDQDNMLAMNLLAANSKWPTLWSWLAMRRYLKTNFMSRLWNYHKNSDGNNGCEPLYWLFRAVFRARYNYEPKDCP